MRYEFHICNFYLDFPNDSAVKNLPTRQGTQVPWVRKIPWRRKWQSTPIFLPAKSQRERSLAGYSPWGHKIFGHNLSSSSMLIKDVRTVQEHKRPSGPRAKRFPVEKTVQNNETGK